MLLVAPGGTFKSNNAGNASLGLNSKSSGYDLKLRPTFIKRRFGQPGVLTASAGKRPRRYILHKTEVLNPAFVKTEVDFEPRSRLVNIKRISDDAYQLKTERNPSKCRDNL